MPSQSPRPTAAPRSRPSEVTPAPRRTRTLALLLSSVVVLGLTASQATAAEREPAPAVVAPVLGAGDPLAELEDGESASVAEVAPDVEVAPGVEVGPDVPAGPGAGAAPLAAAVADGAVPAPPVAFRTTPEAPSRYQGQVSCDPVEKPGPTAVRAMLRATYGTANAGGSARSCSSGGKSEHKEGRAYDWMLDAGDASDRATAETFLAWLVGPDEQGVRAGNAHRLGIQYVIWNRQTWQSWTGAWKPYTGASPHTDHIHISFSWDGAFARTSWWTGAAVPQVDHGPCPPSSGALAPPWSAPNYTPCSAVQVDRSLPTGAVEGVRVLPGGAVLSGWARDVDTDDPLGLNVYVDGRLVGSHRADRPRGTGDDGFEIWLPLDAGSHRVCVNAVNVGPGSYDPAIGCPVVAPASGVPFGALDAVSAVPGGVRVKGWTIDPDTADPVRVHLHAGGPLVGAVTAAATRNDVAGVYRFSGAGHGFDTVVDLPAGQVEVCAVALNVGPGSSDPRLGCRSVRALGHDPVGRLDAASGGVGTVSVRGWALDPDLSNTTGVRVSVDGTRWKRALADETRTDVERAYPAWGSQRGFTATVTRVSPGRHTVCAYAVNRGPGDEDPSLGCTEVTVR